MLMHALKQIAARDAARMAINDGSIQLTYGELIKRAESLAIHCRDHYGLLPGMRAAIESRDGIARIVAILATQSLGCAYVPLDPDQPVARRSRILETCRPQCILDAATLNVPGDPASGSISSIMDDHESYVIYTSGSTGVPKGVSIAASSVRYLAANRHVVRFHASDIVLNASHFCFDITTFEIWSALLNGACIVPYPRMALADPQRLSRVLRKLGVTVAFLPSRVFDALFDYNPNMFAGLRVLFVGGEVVDAERMRALARSSACPEHVVNAYGPTECTAWALFHRINPTEKGPVPIGTPLDHVRCVVLSASDTCHPQGKPVTGELALLGPQLARGYVGDASATRKSFPVINIYGRPERIYRTGDWVERRSDGQILYLGRMDDQCKVNGFRVDVHEMAQILQVHAGFKRAIVAPIVGGGRTRLAAAVVPSPMQRSENSNSLVLHAQRILKEHLPAEICPRHMRVIDALPVDANGKTDRHAIRALFCGTQQPTLASQDDDPIADKLLQWLHTRVAHCEPKLTVHSRLAALALDSVDVLQLLAHIASEMQVHLSLAEYRGCRDIAALACLARTRKTTERIEVSIPQESKGQPDWQHLPFLPIHAAKVAEHADASLREGNELTAGMTVIGFFDPALWKAAIEHVWRRHCGLQLAVDPGGFFRRVACCTVTMHPAYCSANKVLHRRSAGTLESPLFEVIVVPEAPEKTNVYLCFHHIVMDMAAIRLVQAELLSSYAAHAGVTLNRQLEASAQYDEFVTAELQRRLQPAYQSHVQIACERLAGRMRWVPTQTAAPGEERQADHLIYDFPTEVWSRIMHTAGRLMCTPFALLAAGFSQALHQTFALEDATFGIIAAQRNTAREASIVGLMRDHRVLCTQRTHKRLAFSCVDIEEQMNFPSVYLFDLQKALLQVERQKRPVFNVLFDYQGGRSTSPSPDDSPFNMTQRWLRHTGTINRDLSCQIAVQRASARLTLRYRRGAFADGIISGFQRCYLQLLEGASC